MGPKVIIEQRVLDGGDGYRLQPVATIYIGMEEYRVYVLPKATGSPLEWVAQMKVRQDGGVSEYEIQEPRRGQIIEIVSKELERLDHEDKPATEDIYCKAQICLNGDVKSSDDFPFDGTKHCTKCGAECISACVTCKTPIRGKIKWSAADYKCPSFCHACGKPYPWMSDKLNTAKELLSHDDKLTFQERKDLWDLLQYVMSNPKADLVPAKSKLIGIKIQKATQPIREFVLDLLAKYGAEMSK